MTNHPPTDGKNTVKAGLTPRRVKRAKRTVETTDFDAFTRRILHAYGRRVINGDVEALHALRLLAAEVDAVTRLAVLGLRKQPYGYSWQELADRLGTTRQAAQMRYGDRTERGALDPRLIDAGQAVTVAILAQVFADHHPGIPTASACPGCGYRYPTGVSDCPTNATVRPLLYRRRSEDKTAIDLLSSDQRTDLHDLKTARNSRAASRQAGRPTPSLDRTANLLDLLAGPDSTS